MSPDTVLLIVVGMWLLIALGLYIAHYQEKNLNKPYKIVVRMYQHENLPDQYITHHNVYNHYYSKYNDLIIIPKDRPNDSIIYAYDSLVTINIVKD